MDDFIHGCALWEKQREYQRIIVLVADGDHELHEVPSLRRDTGIHYSTAIYLPCVASVRLTRVRQVDRTCVSEVSPRG